MDRKWRHADFSDGATWRRRSNIKADSKRQQRTSYSRLIMTSGLSLTVSELLAFVCEPEMTSCRFSARWRRRSNIKTYSERQQPTSYSRFIITFGLSLTIFDSSYLYCKFWLCIPIKGRKLGGFRGRMPPKCDFCLWWPQKGTSLRQNTSFEPSSVIIGAVVWAVCCLVNKYSTINLLIKRLHGCATLL